MRDTKPGTFRKVFSFTDSRGGCKGHVGSCVENNCQDPVTYGGPIVNFRWDQMASMQFSKRNCTSNNGIRLFRIQRLESCAGRYKLRT
jgi:hypothetical protein